MPDPTPSTFRGAKSHADSPWPLVFAFAVLAGSLGAVVTTILGVEVPNWFTSIWLWVPLLAVTAVALLLATEKSRERLRRRMRNALVLSLLAHLILAIYLKDQFLAFVSAPKELDEEVRLEPLPTLPQYFFRPPETTETTQSFEQPVQASVPQPTPVLERLESELEVNLDRAPTPRPLPTETPVPAPIPFERAEISAPRRAETAGELSRQEVAQAELAPQSAERVQFTPQQSRQAPSPSASQAQLARAEPTVNPRRARRAALELTDAPTARNNRRVAQDTPAPNRQPTRSTLARRSPQPARATNETATDVPATQPRQASRPRAAQSDALNSLTAPAVAVTRSSRPSRPARARSRSRTESNENDEALAQASPSSRRREFSRANAADSGAGDTGSVDGDSLAGSETSRSSGPPTRRGIAAAQLPSSTSAEPLADAGRQRGETGQARPSGEAVAELAPSGDRGTVRRRRASIPVRNRAARGDGGLGITPSPNIGVASRRASTESSVVHSTPSRFLNRRSVGPAALGSQSRTTAEPFARRGFRRTQQASNDPRRPSAATDLAIERGLQYLASVQAPDGRWSLQRSSADPETADAPARIVADSAATGMALLAFLGAGYDHFGDKYEHEVARGLQFLIENQSADGDLYLKQPSRASSGVWFYSHGIAAMALCEAYGMTGDQSLKSQAQNALNFIVASQSPDRGGWRYEPRVSSDLSVSGWQIMALKSGKLAGLQVPPEALRKARQLLDNTQSTSDGGTFVYNPWAARSQDSANDRAPSSVMTAVGLLMRLYTGWTRDHPSIRDGADMLRDRLAESTQPYAFAGLKNPNRDTYYWYNATQVMFHMQGDHWEQWNQRLYPMLAESQVKEGALAGSWHPTKPVPDRWGAYAGRVYVTALNLLSLEVYYRHLPLFDEGLAATP